MSKRKKRITKITIILVIVIILILSVIYNLRYSPELNGFYRLLFGDQILSGETTPLDTGVTYTSTAYKDVVALTGGGQMMFVKKNGEALEDPPEISMNSPVLSTAGDYLIAGDTDGTTAVVFHKKKKIHTIHTDAPIFFARVNSSGYFIIASEEKGYKALVTVYNPKAEAIYKWHSGNRNVLDADVDYDGSSFKISLLDTTSGSASGKLLFFNMSEADPIAEVAADENLFFSIYTNRDHSLTALGDSSLNKYSPNGTLLWSVDFENRNLIGADITSHDRLVVVLAGEENSGLYADKSVIYVYNRDGKLKNKNEIDGQIESLSVAGNTAVGLINKKISVINLNGSGNVLLTPERDIRSVVLFDCEDRVLALSSAGYQVLKVR